MLDLIIKNGRIVDGTGNPWYVADVGVSNGKIREIGNLEGVEAAEIMDAGGKYVSPGFIDMHQHADFTLLAGPTADSALKQGITSVIVGLCGLSACPVNDPELIKAAVYGYQPSWGVEIDWKSVGDYLERLRKAKPSVNVGTLVGHGALRLAAIGFANRPCTDDELQEIKALLEKSLDEGALGLTSGLEYSPGLNADISEMIELNKIVANRKKVYHTHLRNKEFQLREALEEAITTARESGVSLEISHLTPRFWGPPGSYELITGMLENAREEGIDVTCDIYPHPFAAFSLAQFIPPWAFVDGPAGVLKHLKNPESRAKILQHTNQPLYQLVKLGKWENIILATSVGNPDLVGKNYFEIAKIKNTDPHNAMLDTLLEEGMNFFNLLGYCITMDDKDTARMIQYRGTILISDNYTLSPRGVLKDTVMGPAAYSWTIKYLTQFIRDGKAVSLEEAIKKMTSLPAQKNGLADRGLIKPGIWADMVVFDYENLKDNATLANPNQSPSGIEHVFVNGSHVIKNGEHTDSRAGHILVK